MALLTHEFILDLWATHIHQSATTLTPLTGKVSNTANLVLLPKPASRHSHGCLILATYHNIFVDKSHPPHGSSILYKTVRKGSQNKTSVRCSTRLLNSTDTWWDLMASVESKMNSQRPTTQPTGHKRSIANIQTPLSFTPSDVLCQTPDWSELLTAQWEPIQ